MPSFKIKNYLMSFPAIVFLINNPVTFKIKSIFRVVITFVNEFFKKKPKGTFFRSDVEPKSYHFKPLLTNEPFMKGHIDAKSSNNPDTDITKRIERSDKNFRDLIDEVHLQVSEKWFNLKSWPLDSNGRIVFFEEKENDDFLKHYNYAIFKSNKNTAGNNEIIKLNNIKFLGRVFAEAICCGVQSAFKESTYPDTKKVVSAYAKMVDINDIYKVKMVSNFTVDLKKMLAKNLKELQKLNNT